MRYIPLHRIDELELALDHIIKTGSLTQRRDALACALGLHGLRSGEVSQAKFEHLRLLEQQLFVPIFKRCNARHLRLDGDLIQAIITWRWDAGLAKALPLLPSSKGRPVASSHFQRFASGLFERVFGEPLRFHTFRHTFAMRVLAETSDIMLVKKLLGHRSINSTMVYAESIKEVPASCLVKLRIGKSSLLPGLQIFFPEGEVKAC